ncbi:TIR domain-containing protein [Frankia sp. AgB1.9]|uniref:toll/interleukin-1 receptor domain-containing protein n=1 Tax=unclassified Frankia TaxID=2632575 RepID=UPI001933076B|nr:MULTISPECIES: toll/interleukin-1 receptor domain-containing protein [unclassified Frankia]MBL7492207.1 TIR domain-containing protein [Frankia sp. AgW1.1]MBL7551527.1 TIR domain-containing protein [Frankia sp. AgB1.9]MBL7617779.1 TIR domain-containing protein [Frankia sp. AgB1.8]
MAGLDDARVQEMDGRQRRVAREALGAAFPSWGRFAELLDRVNRRITDYGAERTPLPDVVYAVVEGALAEGWLTQLLDEAARANPGNRLLSDVVTSYRVTAGPGAANPATEVISPPDVRTVIGTLADEFSDPTAAKTLIAAAGLRPARQPTWQVGNAELFWFEVYRLYEGGAVVGGWPLVLREAYLQRPANPVIRAAALAAGVADATASSSPPAESPPLAQGGTGRATSAAAGPERRTAPPANPTGTASVPRADARPGVPNSGTSAGGTSPATGVAAGAGPATEREWDFFVSYTAANKGWAEWIAWQLEEAGYTVYIQAWDFVPGSNWMNMMTRGIQRANRTITVLSHAYIDSVWGTAEWQAALRDDPEGFKRKVIPVRVEDCERPTLLETVVGVDLFDLPEDETAARLLAGVAAALGGRTKPNTKPSFPPNKGGAPPAR